MFAVLLGLELAALPHWPALGIRRKEHVGVDLAADSGVLPVPVLHDRRGETGQIGHERSLSLSRSFRRNPCMCRDVPTVMRTKPTGSRPHLAVRPNWGQQNGARRCNPPQPRAPSKTIREQISPWDRMKAQRMAMIV